MAESDPKARPDAPGFLSSFQDSEGKVTTVVVRKSTGYAILDNEVVKTLLSWQGKPGPIREIDVPIDFQLTIGP